MKYVVFLLFAVATLSPALAQQPVDTKDIIAKINRNEPVFYQNVTITGDLDLTSLANRQEERDGILWGGSRAYRSVVTVPLTFKNCTFRGNVWAYRTEPAEERRLINRTDIVYNADFREAVQFENCVFDKEATFKYSRFSQRAQFTGDTFGELALFKYAQFRAASDFGSTTFRSYADFKYTQFDEQTAFEGVRFGRQADFKYTKFGEGVTFRAARFDGPADFKYVHFPRRTAFDNAQFDGSTDFKYATLNGQKFAPGR